MQDFKFSYDNENDDLFIYLDGAKSAGAVEIGDFIFDFDENENLAAVQIINASKILSKLASRIIKIEMINEIKAEVINFRNMAAIRLRIIGNNFDVLTVLTVPKLKEESPALGY